MLKVTNPIILFFIFVLIIGGIIYFSSLKNSGIQSPSLASLTTGSKSGNAPELSEIAGYINSNSSLTISSLSGKVILVDFWTYSCINCIRTTPYLVAWDEKYRDDGLVIIGVHSPEFEFEKDFDNVKKAVEKAGIEYPVVLDNSFSTWRNYQNQYWPHKFLIDRNGNIRYDHIGEGNYEETEEVIQNLLMENYSGSVDSSLASNSIEPNVDFSKSKTPELYLGYEFARAPLGNIEGFKPNQVVDYSILADTFVANRVYFDGNWKNTPDYMELASDTGKIILKYKAQNVNIVCGGNSTISLKIDGQSVPLSILGSDFKLQNGSSLYVSSERLYSIIEDSDNFQKTLEIDVSGKGFRIYTFTFG